MGLFDRLFGRQPATASDPLLGKALDRTVEVVEPKLAVVRDWRSRLTPGVAAAIEVARAGAQHLQQVHDLSAANWSSDPLLRAAFANADSITQVLARMRELQRFMRAPGAGSEAYAVLGMAFATRKVLGAALQGDQVRHEVEQTQANFGDYRIRIVAASADELRRAAGVQIFNELLLAATRELASADERRTDLNVERAMLQARLRMLEQNEGALLADEGEDRKEAADPLAERADLRRRLDEMNAAMAQYGGGTEGLDRQLDIVRDTLLSAREQVRIGPHRLRVDAMNNVLDDADAGGTPIEFVYVQAPRMSRAFALVRVQRADVPAGGLSIAAVERTL
jgi:hypothetical protein